MHEQHVASPHGRASFRRRLLAFLLDAIALFVMGFALLALTTAFLGPTVVLDLDLAASPVSEVRGWRVILNAALLAALSGAYFVVAWARFGCTPGQRLLRLVVTMTSSHDARLSTGRATLRWALLGTPLGLLAALTVNAPLPFLVVCVLSFGWFAVLILSTLLSRSGRGVHDRLSGTTVSRRA